MMRFAFAAVLVTSAFAQQASRPVTISFRAVVGTEDLVCGKAYSGIGVTKSTITPRDFRFYLHNVRLVSAAGQEVAVELKQDDRWQLDNLALLDFENATGACANGTPEINTKVVGTIPANADTYTSLRFTLGVPFEKNHTDLTKMPPPLNLTALAWVWNAGRKFARLDFASTGSPRGVAIHLGSTGCTPNDTKAAVPTRCAAPNRAEVEIRDFDVSSDVVLADLAALLQDSDVDQPKAGCMSGPRTEACGPLFANLGLSFANQDAKPQTFFRRQARNPIDKIAKLD